MSGSASWVALTFSFLLLWLPFLSSDPSWAWPHLLLLLPLGALLPIRRLPAPPISTARPASAEPPPPPQPTRTCWPAGLFFAAHLPALIAIPACRDPVAYAGPEGALRLAVILSVAWGYLRLRFAPPRIDAWRDRRARLYWLLPLPLIWGPVQAPTWAWGGVVAILAVPLMWWHLSELLRAHPQHLSSHRPASRLWAWRILGIVAGLLTLVTMEANG